MKKITFFLFLFANIIANAQSFTVKGTVYDENKKPLAGASILVKEKKLGTSTDFDGNFSLKLAKGTYTLEVSFLGYKTISDKIIINQNEAYDIILKQDETVLEEVLVSAVRANTDVPVTFSNLSKKEITKRNLGQDIPILLNYMPSVVSSSDAGAGVGYTYMSVRGSNGERINVTVNGIPYNDAESHGTFWVNLGDFASSTQNLQLQRGVGTSTNGSGAFGASLNILTDAVSDEAFGEISNSFGSYNTRKHTVKFSTGKINDHIEIAGRLSNISSDGYIDRATSDLKSYYLQGSYTDENTLIKAITFGGKEKTYQAWYGLTADELAADRRQNPYTYDNEVDDYGQNHYQLHWNEKLNDNWSTNLGLNYTKGSGFFEQFEDDTDEIDLYDGIVVATDSYINDWGEVVPITDVIRRRWLENDFYVVNFNTNYKTDHLNLISGISYSNYTGDHFGEVIWAKELSENANIRDRYYFSDAKKTDFSVFTKATFDISENLAGYADLQGRFVNYETAGLTSDRDPIDVDASFSFFNPKFGLTYKINNSNKLYTSFAVANREPNRNDFEGDVTTPERLNDLEFGWRLNKPTIKLNTNIYYMDYKNQLVLTGALDDVGAPIRATSGSSYRLGLEIDADIKISNKFSIKPNAAFSSNKNRDFFVTRDGNENPTALGNTDISFSPDVVVGNMLNYNPTENLQISFLSKFVGKQFMSNFSSAISENDVLDSFFTSDLNIVYQIKPNKIFKSITLTALVNNIFDTEYVDRGYYGIYDDDWSVAGVTTTVDYAGYFPQATRNFLIGATLRF
ncbi:TonB-dependent receptor [Polaribacter vadi]|uniref:TonB-dependent receptor n=1 Tax=Polaribacter TaxID=52959 RepID=UPI001C07FE68|nr:MULTISPECIES: TonB-dependent receptor [Polaribacter]MBU3011085.1 TonB-dependent receptor [Polaribacter vadi]MDO6740899.1 TonB-dependent receptor [Polaribacter sp. 1_MG-2023]